VTLPPIDPLSLAVGAALGALLAALAVAAWTVGRARAAEARAEATERFAALRNAADEDLAAHQAAVSELVRPLAESLEAYRRHTSELEDRRLRELGDVGSQLRTLGGELARVGSALRSAHVRGRWGEVTLRRTAELAGLSAHCDFSEQAASDGGRLRPDMRVQLPGGREIVIDAKVPLDGYLDAVAAAAEPDRVRALAVHASSLRRHVEALAARDYAAQLPDALDFVVLFLPHDALLAAACERQPDLVEFALARGVVFATPSTLFALLAAVARGWREERLAESAREIVGLAEEMQDRLAIFAERFARMGAAVNGVVTAFNAALGSLEQRLLPQARRLRELGAAGTRALPDVPPVDDRAREPRAPARDGDGYSA
jgi:DNA recombination protein RmuC